MDANTIAALDQSTEDMKNLARIAAYCASEYYLVLLSKKIPEALAAELTLTYNETYIAYMMMGRPTT